MTKITFQDITNLKHNLSASQLKVLDIPNKNTFLVKDLLDRKLKPTDNWKEIWSINYISNSKRYFIRAKALQDSNFLPVINQETTVPIRPQVFKSYALKEWDLIISKDSNIWEACILDKDYINYTISGALYKLPITERKLYLFAFLKHDYFKKQLDLLVPRGAVIRHAKTLFLDCKIPFPNQDNANQIINYVELLVQSIIEKEKIIKKRSEEIHHYIELELMQNQSKANFSYHLPTFSELYENKRLDTGIYNAKYKSNYFLITNYKAGSKSLSDRGYTITRWQNLQVSNIGNSIYSLESLNNFYRLILSKDFTEYMTIQDEIYLGNPKKLKTIKKWDIIFSCRGDLGRTIVFCEEIENTITNIDNVHISNEEKPLVHKIFIGCFLNYMRKKSILWSVSITWSWADSFTKYHFDLLRFPDFDINKQKIIAKKYHNPTDIPKNLSLKSFSIEDHKRMQEAGIVELNQAMKKMRNKLEVILEKIINDEFINIDFDLY